VGWAGSRTTLEYFEAVVPFLKRAAASCPPLEVRLFGVERSVEVPGLTVTTVPWSLEAEKQQIPDFDIGLAYMPESGFARLRGGLKLILYMACGVPVLTSPMGIGDQVVEHGCTGMIARTPEEWVSALVRLANDPALRRELATRARERAVATYSYQAYLPEMLRVLAGRQEAM
jgi:glycosyltransferase involved in cell wall biosynthesis